MPSVVDGVKNALNSKIRAVLRKQFLKAAHYPFPDAISAEKPVIGVEMG